MHFLLSLLILLLPSCTSLGMTPEQRESARSALIAQKEAGGISQAQYDAAIEALDRPNGVDWEQLLLAGGSVISSILLGYPIIVGKIRKERGPVATPQERATRAAATRA